ncbi:hypothetical protein [Shewanella chilikensis]|uniref:hypothetical protein n=2 Tax=Shewanella chilikensis TaxID=558541 RepID=UPI0030CD9B73
MLAALLVAAGIYDSGAKDIVFIMPDIPIGQTDTNEAVFFIPMIEASLGPETIAFQGFLDHTAIGIVAENIVSLTHYPPGLLKDMAVLSFRVFSLLEADGAG